MDNRSGFCALAITTSCLTHPIVERSDGSSAILMEEIPVES